MKKKQQVEMALQSAVRCIVATALAIGDARLAASITEMHNADDLEGLARTFDAMSKGQN